MILDHSFFQLLGFEKTISADVSDFEGAEIIVDLNKPIGLEHEGICDLMVDGSLLDNIFDPATGLKNLARMLRPNGRVLAINLANCPIGYPGVPYLVFSGAWFYDFFVANEFNDVQVYACAYHDEGVATYMIDHRYMLRERAGGILRQMLSDSIMAIVAFAEKGENSTWDRMPTQHGYRPAHEWDTYEATVRKIMTSERPPLLRSVVSGIKDQIRPGWAFVDPNGQLQRPYEKQSEPQKVEPIRSPLKAFWRSLKTS